MTNVRRSTLLLLLALSVVVWGCSGGGGSSPTAPTDSGLLEASADRRVCDDGSPPPCPKDGGGGQDTGDFTVTFSGDIIGSHNRTADSSHIEWDLAQLDVTFLRDAVDKGDICFGALNTNMTARTLSITERSGVIKISYEFNGVQHAAPDIGVDYTLTVDTPVLSGVWPIVDPGVPVSNSGQGTFKLSAGKKARTCNGTGNVTFGLTISRAG